MLQQFEEGMCRIHVYALNEWRRKTVGNHQAPVELAARKSVHTVAHLMGFGPRYCLQLQVVNVTDQVIDCLSLMFHVTKGQLQVDVPSEKFLFIFNNLINFNSINFNSIKIISSNIIYFN